MNKNSTLEKKYFSKYKKPLIPFPNLIQDQLNSFNWFIEEGIKEVFKEFSPINDYYEKKFQLDFVSFNLSQPKHDEEFSKINKLTYEGTLTARVKLLNKTLGTTKEQEIFMADVPLMTSHGTFIINGVERVIVPQLSRSYGVFFTESEIKNKRYFGAKIIPARGVWIEIESDTDGAIYVRIDKKRKFAITSLLRTLGLTTEEEILKAFKGDDNSIEVIKSTLEKDVSKNKGDSFIEIYKRLRDGDLATPEGAEEFIASLFSAERYDISPVGRYRFNQRFNKKMDKEELERRTISSDDMVTIIKNIVSLNNNPEAQADDIDHLGQRRVRYVGEMFQKKFRTGMSQIKRNVQNYMSTIDSSTTLDRKSVV